MFTITTINTANPYALFTETLTLPDSNGAVATEVFSSIVDTPLPIKSKFLLELAVTEASGGNGSANIEVQGSLDQTNWVTLVASVGLSVNTTGLNVGRVMVDLADADVPYYRFRVFTDGTDTLDDATVSVSFAAQVAGHERYYPRG